MRQWTVTDPSRIKTFIESLDGISYLQPLVRIVKMITLGAIVGEQCASINELVNLIDRAFYLDDGLHRG